MVRVLAYRLKDDAGEGESDDYRLVTTLLNARRYPARQLAALYRERWEIESVFAEIKTHQRGARVVFSSKTPEGILPDGSGTALGTGSSPGRCP